MPEATHNRVTLLGRLTRDPEIRSLDGGDQVANFSVATTDTWKNRSGEPQERSQFHPVVICSTREPFLSWKPRSSTAATRQTRAHAMSPR